MVVLKLGNWDYTAAENILKPITPIGGVAIADLLFEYCEDCITMAAVPPATYAACKMRNRAEKDMTISRIRSHPEKPNPNKHYANGKLMEYSPAKYNSKFMTAIWGLYNRYSPHNIKGNDDASAYYHLQQPIAVAPYAIATNFAAANCGKEWNFSPK